jgi:hypothetical protein
MAQTEAEIIEICSELHKIAHSAPRYTFPFNEKEIPLNGIYLLFEKGEHGHQGDRIVRIGSHTGNNQLRSRLKQHFLMENKDRSIFRKNIGRVILSKAQNPFLKEWERDLTTQTNKTKYAQHEYRVKCQEIERQVSGYIQNNFSFVVFEIEEKDLRLELEKKLISTVSRCTECRPSKHWFGDYSPKEKIRKSGLWLVNHLYKTPLERSDLKHLISPTTYYSAMELEEIRRKAMVQQANPDEYSDGWSKSKMDPMKVLDAFSALHIKRGFLLRAYQYVSGDNGNAAVWAMPENSVFPEPDECDTIDDTVLKCPRPPEAFEDIMEVIEGDRTDFSYISASLFAREISEFGSIWHGCSWNSHRILDDQSAPLYLISKEINDRRSLEEMSDNWRPSVSKRKGQIVVNFYTSKGLTPAGIVRHTDIFSIGSYTFKSTFETIVNCGGGYIH